MQLIRLLKLLVAKLWKTGIFQVKKCVYTVMCVCVHARVHVHDGKSCSTLLSTKGAFPRTSQKRLKKGLTVIDIARCCWVLSAVEIQDGRMLGIAEQTHE